MLQALARANRGDVLTTGFALIGVRSLNRPPVFVVTRNLLPHDLANLVRRHAAITAFRQSFRQRLLGGFGETGEAAS